MYFYGTLTIPSIWKYAYICMSTKHHHYKRHRHTLDWLSVCTLCDRQRRPVSIDVKRWALLTTMLDMIAMAEAVSFVVMLSWGLSLIL